MARNKKFKFVTDRRVQGLALLLIAAAGLRRATMAQNVATPAPVAPTVTNSYPLVAVARDFSPAQLDFAPGVGDTLPFAVGNVADTLDANGLPVFTGAGKAVTSPAVDSAGKAIQPSSARVGPLTTFTVSGDMISSTLPMYAKVTVIGVAFSNGATKYPISTRIRVGTALHEPWGSFADKAKGNVNDDMNPRNFIVPGVITPGTAIGIDGQSWTGNSRRPHMTANSASDGAQVVALRDGDHCPAVAGFNGQASALAILEPYLDATGTNVKLKPNQVIYLFELATTRTTDATFDMQDLVVLVDLATSEEYFNTTTTTTTASTDACGNVLNDTPAVYGDASTGGISSAQSFGQWFVDAPGANVAQRTYLSMTRDTSGVYSFSTPDFTPIDGEMYGNQAATHNRGFTLSIDAATTYTQCTGQFIEYTGSGDAWVFINGKLALDMGGTHVGGQQMVSLDRLGLTDGQEVRVQIFYAQRTSSGAAFGLRTNMVLSTPNSVSQPGVSGIRD